MFVVPGPPPVPAAALVTLEAGADARVLGMTAEALLPGARTYIVRLTGGATPAALHRLTALPGVATVEPDRVRRRHGVATTVTTAASPGSGLGDPLRRLQGHLTQIRWVPPSSAKRPFLVAVLDTGADSAVPDLRETLDTKGARSFAPGSPDPLTDTEGHGTHVTGILAAGIDNGIGISGVSGATVLPVKVADHLGQASTSSLVRGINYAVARGARIINISFGGGGRSQLEQTAIDNATRAGAIVVAAAGNSGESGSPREYPGAYRHVIAVGAVDAADAVLSSSTQGPQVALSAPGKDVLSTSPPGTSGASGYVSRSGTSMAAAMVSGVAARAWAARPSLAPSQVTALLGLSARDVGPAGADTATGAGVVDLAAALARPTPAPDSAEPNDDPTQAGRTRPLLPGAGLRQGATSGRLNASSDPRDLYRITLAAGDGAVVRVSEPTGTDLDLVLWYPGTKRWYPDPTRATRWVAGSALGALPAPEINIAAPEAGDYFIEVRAVRGSGRYRLTAARTPAGQS
jgi:subtilisin family serine protease